MKAKVNVIAAMLMFGSIGLFVRGIALPSSVIALVRGVIGCFFLVTAGSLMKQPVNWKAVKSNWLVLVLSGAAIGFNWIFLFEAYRYIDGVLRDAQLLFRAGVCDSGVSGCAGGETD